MLTVKFQKLFFSTDVFEICMPVYLLCVVVSIHLAKPSLKYVTFPEIHPAVERLCKPNIIAKLQIVVLHLHSVFVLCTFS